MSKLVEIKPDEFKQIFCTIDDEECYGKSCTNCEAAILSKKGEREWQEAHQ